VISRRSGAFDGPGGTDVRAGSAVGAEGRVDAGTLFPGGDGVQGADRQTVPAVGAFFGDSVRHILKCGMRMNIKHQIPSTKFRIKSNAPNSKFPTGQKPGLGR